MTRYCSVVAPIINTVLMKILGSSYRDGFAFDNFEALLDLKLERDP